MSVLALDPKPRSPGPLYLPGAAHGGVVPLFGPTGDVIRRIKVSSSSIHSVGMPTRAALAVEGPAGPGRQALGGSLHSRSHTIGHHHHRRKEVGSRVVAFLCAFVLGLGLGAGLSSLNPSHPTPPSHGVTTVTTPPAPPARPPAPGGGVVRPPVRHRPPQQQHHHHATFDHVVKPGDNLWQIATDHRESLGHIEADNPRLHTYRGFDLIWPGQHVKVHPGAR